MRVEVTRIPRPNIPQGVEVEAGARVLDVLRGLQLPPDAVIVLRAEVPIPVDAPVHEGDQLRILNVFSGG